MENKYYQPDISELYVGYETYWIKDHIKELTEDNLIPVIFTSKKLASTLYTPNQFNPYGTLEFKPNLMSLRSKYLDYDLLLQDSWFVDKEYKTEDCPSYNHRYGLGNRYLEKDGLVISTRGLPFYDSYNIHIFKRRHEDPLNNQIDLVYNGKCRGINELRKIVAWIK